MADSGEWSYLSQDLDTGREELPRRRMALGLFADIVHHSKEEADANLLNPRRRLQLISIH